MSETSKLTRGKRGRPPVSNPCVGVGYSAPMSYHRQMFDWGTLGGGLNRGRVLVKLVDHGRKTKFKP